MAFPMFLLHALIALGAALRLTRLITTDKIAEQLVIRHLRRAAHWRYTSEGSVNPSEVEPANFAAYLVELCDCPYCTGWWASLVCVLVIFLVPGIWPSLILGALALSYLVGHISHKLEG